MLRLFNWIGMRFGVSAAWSVFSWGLPLLALAAGAAGGGWAAWQVGRAPLREENAALRISYAEATKLAVLAGARRLQVAQKLGNSLATQLAATLITNDQLALEKTHALSRVATGRTCFSGPVLRVLNGSPGLRVAGLDGLPAPQPAAAAAGATAATDPDPAEAEGERIASDADIGTWAIRAGAQYETCRVRLDALIDWHTPSATEPGAALER